MTAPIAPLLRDSAAALPAKRVSMQAMVHANGPAAHDTLLLPMAMPCLLPVPGEGDVLGLQMSALARVQQPQRVDLRP